MVYYKIKKYIYTCIYEHSIRRKLKAKFGKKSNFIHRQQDLMTYSTDPSKAVVPVLVLLFVALWFILRGNLFYVLPCVKLFLCFSVLLALRLPHLGKRELNLVLFVHMFDLRLLGFCWFPLPLGVWEGLQFVIVALPGLFSYLFCI